MSMATAQAPSSRPAPAKHEAFLEGQLHRAVARVRTFDLLVGLFIFLIISLLYGLTLIVLDAWLELPSLIRQIAFGLYFIGAIAYLSWAAVKQVRWRVNPYYAAVHLERTLPGAKNSLVNWLDLRDQPLPPAIRGAVGARAAKDLSQAKIEQAITGRAVLCLGGGVLGLFILLVSLLAVFGPNKFFGLWHRAFLPFTEKTIPTRTKLEIAEPPPPHNAVVPIGQSVNFAVRVEGRVPKPDQPDAIRLQFRYSQSEPVYQERVLSRGISDSDWGYLLPGSEVQNGFFYKIKGGDFTTPEYQVQARSSPVITGFSVTYKHRPYLQRPPETKSDPNLIGWRGTEVTLVAKTNRTVKEGRLTVETPEKGTFASERVEEDDHALRFRFILVKAGSYHIRFIAADGEASGDSVPYTITILPDNPPVVDLTEPGTEVPVASNGTLPLKGGAKDDYGITDMKLRMRVKGGRNLQAKPYQPGQYRYEDGGYPLEHDYQDFIDLNRLALEDGKPYQPQPGDEIEYWLEATDNCDFPDPKGQVGSSKVYKIKVTKPTSEEQSQKDRKKSEQEQSKHEQQQSDKRQQENQQRKDQAQNASSEQKNDPQSRQDQANKNIQKELEEQVKDKKAEGKPESNSSKPGESKNEGNKNPDKGQTPNQGQNQNPNPNPNQNQNQNQNQSKTGESKPQPKDGGNGKNESKGGENKPQPKPSDKHEGESKDQGQTGQQPKPQDGGGQGKGSEHGSSSQQPQAGKTAGQQHQGENKTGQKPGDAKPEGQGGSKGTDTAGQTRTEKTPTGQTTKGGGHPDGNQKGTPVNDDRPATGEAKPDASAKGNSKGSPSDKPNTTVPSGQAKDKGGDGQPGGAPNGQQKPAKGAEAKNSGGARGDGKDERKNAGGNGEPNLDRVADLAKQAQNGNAKDKADAQKQLAQIAKEAKDAKVREAAQQALKKAENLGGTSPQGTDQNVKNQTAGPTGSDSKKLDKPPSNTAGNSGGKGDDPKRPGQADGGGDKTAKTGDPSRPSAGGNSSGNESNEKTDAKNPTPGQAGNNPGGGQGAQEKAGSPSGNDAAAAAAAANADNKRKANELQLEELMKKITPEMLKERNWTEEDLQRWHNAMKDMIKREHKADMEKLAKPQSGNARLPGGFRQGEKGTGESPDLQNIGKTAPPPEIRNAYQEFTQELSKLKRAK
jgi:hypothetical protein